MGLRCFLALTSQAILPCPSPMPSSHFHIFQCFLFHDFEPRAEYPIYRGVAKVILQVFLTCYFHCVAFLSAVSRSPACILRCCSKQLLPLFLRCPGHLPATFAFCGVPVICLYIALLPQAIFAFISAVSRSSAFILHCCPKPLLPLFLRCSSHLPLYCIVAPSHFCLYFCGVPVI